VSTIRQHVLPPLEERHSPNQSARILPAGQNPHLVVVHRPVGSYDSATGTFEDPASQVSAHLLVGELGARQFVPWDRKAWACVAFNSMSYNVEVEDEAWVGQGPQALAYAARVVAYICTRSGIPPVWSQHPTNLPGVCRHYDLGLAGGGHTDPTTSTPVWQHFMAMVEAEHALGGFRAVYGQGSWPT
jgi:N-acetyl-anhydromuramyl-L-alanine amidase AmpD